jgi:sn-glycerol 3-phosphate transport system permease protein
MTGDGRTGIVLRRVRAAGYYVLLVAVAAVVLFPLYYAIAGSLMSDATLVAFPPALYPTELVWRNYSRVMQAFPLARQYVNSMVVSLAIVAGVLVTSVLSAYAFVFIDFPFRRTAFAAFMATMMIPVESLIIPKYLLVAELGWIDAYPGLIVPFVATGFGTFLMRQFFLAFPIELREAARLDGCGHWRFAWTILVPLSKHGLGVLAVYSFIAAYNQFFWPLLVTNTPDMQTLQIGLASLDTAEARAPSLIFAGVVVAIAPMLVLFYVFQRNIVRGLTAGAVK